MFYQSCLNKIFLLKNYHKHKFHEHEEMHISMHIFEMKKNKLKLLKYKDSQIPCKQPSL